jgi:transglutaminase-like putative cysteine protease
MRLLRQYRFMSFVLVLLAIVAFAIAELDFTMLFTGVVLAVLSWYVTEGPRGRTLPPWATNILTLGALGLAALDFLASGGLADAMESLGRFLLWLLLIKLFSRRGERDDRQRLSIATMLVLVGCLESVTLAFGLLVFAYGGVAAWTAMLYRLSHGAETARASRTAAPGFAPPLELAYGRRAAPQFRGLASVALLLIFAGSALCFFLFPRFGKVRLNQLVGESVTGFNDEIDLRRGDRISESRREIFTVQWIDPAGEPVKSARPLLLRGAVLDRYDAAQERWMARRSGAGTSTFRTPVDGGAVSLLRTAGEPPRPPFRARFEMRSVASEELFSIYAPVGISTSVPRTISVDPRTLLLRDASLDRLGRPWSYELLVQTVPDAATLEDLSLGRREREGRNSGFPVPEVAGIAREILADASRSMNVPPEPGPDATPAERWTHGREVARAIASWMRSRFSYTTDLSMFARVPDEDPIVSFLTRYRAGHCEYFASGLCAVLRSLGIESRIVTGFIAMEYDESGRYYVVRESNAHAWVEVRTGEHAWTAVDATPEDSLLEIQDRNRSVADRFRWIYSRLEFLWNSNVVAYDSGSQQEFASRMRSGWRDAITERLESVTRRMQDVAAELSLGQAGGFWFTTVGVCLGAAGLAALIVVVRRRRLRTALHVERLAPRERRRLERHAAFYVEAVRTLSRAGFEKPDYLSPRAYAERLAKEHPAVGAAFHPIADAFYRVRYGGHAPDAGEANTHLSLVLALRDALAHNSRPFRAD